MTTRLSMAVHTAIGALGAATLTTFVCAQSIPTLEWHLRQLGATPRLDHAMAYLSATRTTYSFGGSDSPAAQPTDAMFAYDGQQWLARFPSRRPGARRGHTLVEDPVRRRLVLFGGSDTVGGLLNDTWEWDGSTWTNVQPAQSPSGRHGHAMAYDHATGRVVLFGGQTNSGVDAQTWAFDGVTWTQLTGNAPTARRHSVLAPTWTGATPQLVLFGGDSGTGLLQDTWLFSGTTWTAVPPTQGPPARRHATLQYHTLLDAPVLLGGEGANGPLADTWRWSGGFWVRQPVTTSGIGARALHASTYDRDRGVLVLQGGEGSVSVSFSQPFEGRMSSTPGRAFAYGQGCGAGGATTIFPGNSSLIPGGSLDVWLIASRFASVGVLNVGLDAQRYGGLTLPLDLTPLGMPGCSLLTSIDASLPTPNPPFGMTATLRFPNDASLGGVRFFVQALFVDPSANAAGIAATNGVEVNIGFAPGGPSVVEVVETFANANQLDVDVSSGTWGNNAARFGYLGLDGRHGAFVADDGVPAGANTFVWNTDSFTIPASRTLSGVAETVTDGVFRFSEFVVPANRTVVFVGSKPARIHVRGRVDVRGRIVANGETMEVHNRSSGAGQTGGRGGPGGAFGGRGAFRPNGAGAGSLFDGGNGHDVTLLGGHAYANAQAGTGGRGSGMIPADGLNTSITYDGLGRTTSAMISAGGGGGGYSGPGAIGRAIFNNTQPVGGLGAPAAGGTAFPLFPLPPAIGGTQRLEHFLVGGSGGGGAGGHPFFSIMAQLPSWSSGSAGSGGGGALALRVGGALNVAIGASIEARGGDCPQGVPAPPPAPGGGGSGGSIVLQVGGPVSQLGQLSVRGGRGGFTNDRITFNLETRGGDGAPGFARLEVDQAQPPLALIGAVEPPAPANAVDTLTDRDVTSGFQSKWYWSDAPLMAQWSSIVVDVTVGGVPVRFSDRANLGARPGPGQPLQLWVQGAKFDPATGQLIPGSEGPWRTAVVTPNGSLSGDGATAVRFQLVGDRSIAGEVVVQRVAIAYQQ